MIEGAAQRLKREQQGRAWLAYHIEGLSRTKQLPDFNEFAGISNSQSPRQSWQELDSILRAMAAKSKKEQ